MTPQRRSRNHNFILFMNQLQISIFSIISFLFISSFQLGAQHEVIVQSYDDKNETTAELLPLVATVPTSGYMPFRLTLKNSSEKGKKWTIKFTSKSQNNHYYSFRNRNQDYPTLISEFSYSCPAGDTKTYEIIVPLTTAIPSHGLTASAELTIELITSGETISDSMSTSQQMDLPATLLSTSLFIHHSSSFNKLITSSSISYRGGMENYTTEFTPSLLSDDWRAYSGFDAIICTDDDWLEMSASAKNAILEWNRLGGNILIYKLKSASNFNSLKIDNSEENINKESITRSFGKVTIKPLSEIKSLNVKQAAQLINPPQIDNSKISRINQDYQTGFGNSATWSLQKALGKLNFSPFYLILILIIFGIMVGPVNLFVFAKAGQRHRLFITTPIIALSASLLLILLIIIQDGFGGHGQRIQLMEVRSDEGENKAYVWQEQVARTGVILNSSFETSAPTYISPVPIERSRFSRVTTDGGGGACNYTAAHGETGLSASGDWFQSRSLHGHYLESVMPTRGRIDLISNQGAPLISATFNFEIQSLFYIDNTGKMWEAYNITAGDSVELTPCDPNIAVNSISQHQSAMTPKLQNTLDVLRSRKNHFIAITENAPAIDTLDAIKWTKTTTIITGPVMK